MRIVQKSNLNKEWYNEKFILWPMNECAANEICEVINKHQLKHNDHFYAVVDNDYKLYEGIQP